MFATTGCFDLLGLSDFREGEGGGGGTSPTTSSGSTSATASTSSSSTSASTGTSSSSGTGGAPECTPPMSQSCYSGAMGTAGVGVCRAGTEACDASGHFGPCAGEVVPTVENCQSDPNESCTPNCGEYVAHHTYASDGEEYFDRIALANNGDLLILGNAIAGHQLDLGGGALDVQGDFDVILARLTPTFGHVWSRTYGFAPVHSAVSSGLIAIDGFAGTDVTVGGTAFLAGDRLLVRIDAATGNVLNAGKNALSPYATGASATGYFEAARSGSNDVLVHRSGLTIDQTLTLWPTSQQVHVTGIEAFAGGAFVYGDFSGNLTVGGMTVSTSQSDGFVLKTVNGAATALTQLHANGSANVRNAAFVGGDLYVVGSFTGSLPDPLSGQTALSQSGADFYIARLQSAGNGLSLTWAKGFPGAGDAVPGPITADTLGFITTSVRVGGDSNFGGGVVPAVGTNTHVLVSYKSDGTHAWSRPLTVWPSGLVNDAAGRIFVVGGYSPGANPDFAGKNFFGSGIDLTGGIAEDAFAAQLFSAAP
ncbi:MAG: hypothetical protein U0414_43215 [Polyangiaceae bacterium]